MSLLGKLREFARHHHLWTAESRVIAAVSGGSDSVAMLFLLHECHTRGEVRLEAVAHLDHQIRPDSAADEQFCRDLAARLGHRYVSRAVDVPALARANKQSLEVAGRLARRQFLGELRRLIGADRVATAHTQDDQLETILMRLLRGTGARGLRGIVPSVSWRIRPVLFATRSELRDHLVAAGEQWREDSTNADLNNVRNRVRHELLPYLDQHFNPSVRRALLRAADILRAEDEYLSRMAAAAAVGVVERQDGSVTVDPLRLRSLPDAIARRVVQHALIAAGDSAPSYTDVEKVRQVAAADDTSADVSRVHAEHFGRKVVLVPNGGASGSRPKPQPTPFCVALPVPGTVRTQAGWLVEAAAADHPQRHTGQPDVAQIDAARVVGGLLVRNRRPGDRIRPLGLGGRKKVQDVLVDRKVSRHERDDVPIVTDESGRIVWLAGQVLSEEFRVTEGTKAVIILKLRRE